MKEVFTLYKLFHQRLVEYFSYKILYSSEAAKVSIQQQDIYLLL
jgi:hypothetical protein